MPVLLLSLAIDEEIGFVKFTILCYKRLAIWKAAIDEESRLVKFEIPILLQEFSYWRGKQIRKIHNILLQEFGYWRGNEILKIHNVLLQEFEKIIRAQNGLDSRYVFRNYLSKNVLIIEQCHPCEAVFLDNSFQKSIDALCMTILKFLR